MRANAARSCIPARDLVYRRLTALTVRQAHRWGIFRGRRLELHFPPSYAPELNPDEFVWNHLKRQGVSKTPLRRDESLRSRVQSDLAHIQSRPPLVRSFFHAPSVAYTRD